MSYRLFALLAILCGPSTAATAAAADYPERPLRYVMGSAAGGGPDVAARVVMAQLSRQLGQQIVIEHAKKNPDKLLFARRNSLPRTSGKKPRGGPKSSSARA